MDDLPQAIQNEIWQYVRGDRSHWKLQFRPTLKCLTRGTTVRGFEKNSHPLIPVWFEIGGHQIRGIVDTHNEVLLGVYPWVPFPDANRRRAEWIDRLDHEFPKLFNLT